MTDAIDFEKEFHDVLRTLDDAAHQLQQNSIPALKALEARVTGLCQKVSGGPPETAKKIQPLMGRAIQKLDVLAQDLQAYQNRIKKEG